MNNFIHKNIGTYNKLGFLQINFQPLSNPCSRWKRVSPGQGTSRTALPCHDVTLFSAALWGTRGGKKTQDHLDPERQKDLDIIA